MFTTTPVSFLRPLALATVFLGATHLGHAQNSIIGIPSTFGGNFSLGEGVNYNGTIIVGDASVSSGDPYAFRWTSSGGMVNLGALGGTQSTANSVSSDGTVIVGDANDASENVKAYRYVGGVMSDLGTLGGTTSLANEVSRDGAVVVGQADLTGDTASSAFRWTSGGGMVNLGTLGGDTSAANGVNGDGSVVVGQSLTAGLGDTHAFRWTSGSGMVDLGTLGGSESAAFGVSANGEVIVGESLVAGDARKHVFRWENNVMQDLGAVPTLGNSSGMVISDDGDLIAGVGDSAETIIWDEAHGLRDLSAVLTSLGLDMSDWVLKTPSAIGFDAGYYYIVGFGQYQGDTEAYMVTLAASAVPEPSTYALMLIGGALAFYVARRKKSSTLS